MNCLLQFIESFAIKCESEGGPPDSVSFWIELCLLRISPRFFLHCCVASFVTSSSVHAATTWSLPFYKVPTSPVCCSQKRVQTVYLQRSYTHR